MRCGLLGGTGQVLPEPGSQADGIFSVMDMVGDRRPPPTTCPLVCLSAYLPVCLAVSGCLSVWLAGCFPIYINTSDYIYQSINV